MVLCVEGGCMKLLKPRPLSLPFSAINSTESFSNSASAQAAKSILPRAKLEGPAMAKRKRAEQSNVGDRS
jgi:hypothetical protein